MNKFLLAASFLLASACVSAPKHTGELAKAIGYVKAVNLNGASLGPNDCHIYIGGVKAPLIEGQIIEAEVPVGKITIGDIVCDQGNILTSTKYPMAIDAQVKPGSLNLLAELDIRLTAPGAIVRHLIGGQIGTNIKYRPLSASQIHRALTENPQLRLLKRSSAIEFEYTRMSQ